jgi:hypothetical protein
MAGIVAICLITDSHAILSILPSLLLNARQVAVSYLTIPFLIQPVTVACEQFYIQRRTIRSLEPGMVYTTTMVII